VLQRSAVCCSVLQCVVVCCNVLQCIVVYCSVLSEIEFETALTNLPKGVLQSVAECCSVLQCVAVWCSVVQCIAAYCSALQCAAVSALQCVAVCRGEINLKTALTTLPPGVLQCVLQYATLDVSGVSSSVLK